VFNNKPFRKNDYHFTTGVRDSSFPRVTRGGEMAPEKRANDGKMKRKKKKKERK